MCDSTINKFPFVATKDQLAGVVEKRFMEPNTRAVLVGHADNDSFRIDPVKFGDSILNISNDLIKHLNEYPHKSEWLVSIKAAIDRRLASRENATAVGRVSLPDARTRHWS